MSDVWGTVYRLERDKALGNDSESLRREIARLRRLLTWCRPRLRIEEYRLALDRYFTTPTEPDLETKLIHSNLSE